MFLIESNVNDYLPTDFHYGKNVKRAKIKLEIAAIVGVVLSLGTVNIYVTKAVESNRASRQIKQICRACILFDFSFLSKP